MIEIDDGHDIPQLRHLNQPGKRTRDAIDEYKAAYKALYGLTAPEVSYRDGFVYVTGVEGGVSLSIFRERIKQLKYRKG